MLGFIISFIFVLVAILLLRQDWANITVDAPHSTVPPARLIIKDELSLYTGEADSKGLYLAILGQVFDVEKGMKHYGPGGGYRFFAGKDASLSFVTGDFTDTGLTDDLSSLSPAQVVSLYDWLAFYHKDYEPVDWWDGSTVRVESPPRPCYRWRQPWSRGGDSRTKPWLRSNTSQPATRSGTLPGGDGSGAPPRVVECRETGPAYLGSCSLLARAALAVCVSRIPPCWKTQTFRSTRTAPLTRTRVLSENRGLWEG
ncbi:neuferricin isoform X2 [Oncorhynchus masou masou]|uniref:neuferricin isoform X2 n=1 Tax=Oncorhynchus masou masou TaxID=90313 RepID=UPI0031842D95